MTKLARQLIKVSKQCADQLRQANGRLSFIVAATRVLSKKPHRQLNSSLCRWQSSDFLFRRREGSNDCNPLQPKGCMAVGTSKSSSLKILLCSVLFLQGCVSNDGGYPVQLQQLIAQQQDSSGPISVDSLLSSVRDSAQQPQTATPSHLTLQYSPGDLLPQPKALAQAKLWAKRYPIMVIRVGRIEAGNVFESVAVAQRRAEQLLNALDTPFAKPLLEYQPKSANGSVELVFDRGL